MKKINMEKILSIIADIFLLGGIISFFVLFFTLSLDFYGELDWMWFGISLGILFYSVMMWAFLKVIGNISNNLKNK